MEKKLIQNTQKMTFHKLNESVTKWQKDIHLLEMIIYVLIDSRNYKLTPNLYKDKFVSVSILEIIYMLDHSHMCLSYKLCYIIYLFK